MTGLSLVQLALLAAEVENDPAAVGYAAPLARGDVEGVAALLAAPTATAKAVTLGEVPAAAVRACITLEDWRALTDAERAYVALVLAGETVDLSAGAIDAALVRPGGIWEAGATRAGVPLTSRPALMRCLQRKPRRAEEVLGVGAVVTHADVSAALRYADAVRAGAVHA